jgi:hypothetical protein
MALPSDILFLIRVNPSVLVHPFVEFKSGVVAGSRLGAISISSAAITLFSFRFFRLNDSGLNGGKRMVNINIVKASVLALSLFLLLPLAWAQTTTTLLNVDMDINGSSSQAGDVFTVHVLVENVGVVDAVNVKGDLRNTPDSWIVFPFTNNGPAHVYGSYDFGTLAPGQIKTIDYIVTRDATNPGPILANNKIWYRTFADNAPVTESGDINVPVSPLVLAAVATGMIGSAMYIRRKKSI